MQKRQIPIIRLSFSHNSLLYARMSWLVIVVLCLITFALSIPARYQELLVVGEQYPATLAMLGISAPFLAIFLMAWDILVVLICTITAVIIFWYKPSDWFAALLASMLSIYSLWVTRDPSLRIFLSPALFSLYNTLRALEQILTLLACYLFPTGKFVPRWSFFLALIWTLLTILWLCIPNLPLSPIYAFNSALPLTPQALLFTLLWYGTGVYAQIYRYIFLSNQQEKQQTKWVISGLIVALCGLFIFKIFPALMLLWQPGISKSTYALLAILYCLIGVPFFYILALSVPVAFMFSIVRYKLYGIEIVIKHTLVYGALIAIITIGYTASVSICGLFTRGQLGNSLISLLATSFIALIFQPLRLFLQHRVDRLLYGESHSPYTVLKLLGKQLAMVPTPEMVLPTLASELATLLKLPYIALSLKQDEAFHLVAAHGTPHEPLFAFPFVYQTGIIGHLTVSPREMGGTLRPRDSEILKEVTHQIGGAVYAVHLARRLTAELQRSLTATITAREEERRRLRRDIHDSLGPTLAILALQAGDMKDGIKVDPEKAILTAGKLQDAIRAAIKDIRTTVNRLRPPLLDELGLLSALQECIAQYTNQPSLEANQQSSPRLQIILQTPDAFPVLHPAIEVTIYYIVQEALTNIARHAQARHCSVTIQVTEKLLLEIVDDGVGLPSNSRMGMGLLSMRERATELGGFFALEQRCPCGTRVYVQLPFL